MIRQIWREWRKWRNNWDDLCKQCGKCCYRRSIGSGGEVIIHYSMPCENLNLETHQCTVFHERFRKCDHCGKVGLMTALFHPTLPDDCAYRQTFRVWESRK